MMRRLGLCAAMALILGTPVVLEAADWDPIDVTVSSGEENVTLGVSGRNAGVDANGRIHLVFQKNLDGENFEVLCTVRELDESWSDAELVSLPGTNARNASAVVDETGGLHVVFEDISDGEGEIVYRLRSAGGTWEDPVFVSPSSGFSRRPVLAVDAFNQVHVVWVDGRQGVHQILYAVASPGDVFSPAQTISIGGVTPEDPNIDADGVGAVHIVWTDRGTTEQTRSSFDVLYLKVSSESGGTPSPVRLVDHAAIALRPFLDAMDDGTLHLVWLDDRWASRNGAYEIYYKRYLPGIGWGRDKRFTYDEVDHGRPVITAGIAQTVNVVWEDYRSGTPDIYYRQITWETGWDRDPTQLTSDVSSSQAPSLIALDDGRLVLFWTDAQGSGTFKVFAKDGDAGVSP